MNDTAPTRPLDRERAMDVMAYAALIDTALDGGRAVHAAQHLLNRLACHGRAEARHTGGAPIMLRVTILGITAEADSTHGALRAWQEAARDRLAQGVL